MAEVPTEDNPSGPAAGACPLALFRTHNPLAEIDIHGEDVRVLKPWADSSFELEFSLDDEEIVSALNAIYLPPRLTAIWHRDTKDLEVIWTPYGASPETRARSFEFRFNGCTLRCEYGDSSERLFAIARAFAPVGPGYTNHRNLPLFQQYLHAADEGADDGSHPWGDGANPTCFWIRQVEWDEETIASIVRHVNFYAYTFDRRTPQILVHNERPAANFQAPHRFPRGEFPTIISGRRIDPYLMGLWETAMAAGTHLQFLYCYQVLEYASFYYVQESIMGSIRRVLLAPDTACRPADATKQILEIITQDKDRDEAKLIAVIRQLVDPADVWNAITPNLDYFCSEVRYDGGFTQPPLVRNGWTLEDFSKNWIPIVPDMLRKMRNALVHSREARQNHCVAPTVENLDRLRPWLDPLMTITMSVMMYTDG